jgi:hypothetical protein
MVPVTYLQIRTCHFTATLATWLQGRNKEALAVNFRSCRHEWLRLTRPSLALLDVSLPVGSVRN